jgi:preprotein translocase subunit SecA
MAKLRHSIRFMQYAQKNPLQLYVLDANKLFGQFKKEVKQNTVRSIINILKLMQSNDLSIPKERQIKDFKL